MLMSYVRIEVADFTGRRLTNIDGHPPDGHVQHSLGLISPFRLETVGCRLLSVSFAFPGSPPSLVCPGLIRARRRNTFTADWQRPTWAECHGGRYAGLPLPLTVKSLEAKTVRLAFPLTNQLNLSQTTLVKITIRSSSNYLQRGKTFPILALYK